MLLTISEKIKIILKRKGLTLGDLANMTGQSRQNLSNKIKRNNFSEKEMKEIAAALGYTIEICFVPNNDEEKNIVEEKL